MTDIFETQVLISRRPELPTPARTRWQPLRLGLVELFHYDSEEFWFHDGHLLLRGNNGTGKSKVLSLTLPFLLDAQLRASRIEPDGDVSKKMTWNLLMNGYDRRVGYAWIEFGRLADDGLPRYLTLGAGLSAAAARPQVDSWYFVLEGAHDAQRIGQDLWLTNPQRVVLSRERLRESIEGRGQVFDTAANYRRAVDERLFHLGTKRYDALVDTLIQLRQPQLSRKPDEGGLSNALTEALPPMPLELLSDVAEALNQLEEDRRQLEEFQQLGRAVERFDQRYRVYAGTLSRRQAREVRQAQTDFDNSSRVRNEAQTRLQRARSTEVQAQTTYDHAELTLAGQRARLETLQSDPTMQDANRLESAEKESAARQRALQMTEAACIEAGKRRVREDQATRQSTERAAHAEQLLIEVRQECAGHAIASGVGASYSDHPIVALPPIELAELTPRSLEAAQSGLRVIAATRREQLAFLRQRHASAAQAETVLAQRQQSQLEKKEEADATAQRREEADAAVENQGLALIEAWSKHFASLLQLKFDSEFAVVALGDWVLQLCGDNPAQRALQAQLQQASLRLAARQVELDGLRDSLEEERALLESEGGHLTGGRDTAPPLPYTRSAATRDALAGTPLWKLIDFHDHVEASARAGLEAAIEAAGLIDAWVTPDGSLVTPDGRAPWLDHQLIARPLAPSASLTQWLRAAVPDDVEVAEATVERLLAGVACSPYDSADEETWVAPDGRFRLGTLTGAWAKPDAVFIGFAARAAARARRLNEIARKLDELTLNQAEIALQRDQLATARSQVEHEWRTAPSDQPLRQAHLAATARAREFNDARHKLAQAETQCREAEQATQIAREVLERDATDLRLPLSADALLRIEEALNEFNDAQYRLVQTAHEWRRALPEHRQQLLREAEARQDLHQCELQLAANEIEVEEAKARYEVLRDTVGAKVETLRGQLADARSRVIAGETAQKFAVEGRRTAGEARAIANAETEAAETALAERTETRLHSVSRLQRFAASSLLSSALPDIELPDPRNPWTIDPALSLARRVEHALAHIKDDDDTWARVQKQTAEDLQDLQRSLSALAHQATAEPNDWGLVVHIIYQNSPRRPDQLAARLADEIAQRSQLLTAKERAVLENHLQAEIASEVQRLLKSAVKQVDAINTELKKRPSSTGVRFRLQWLPLAEGEGTPIGLAAARQRLLNTSADLWSAEDRQVVGAMLQQRISSERERADAGVGRDGGGSLIEQLARALDYRRWHQFRVERSQDGQWRKLSGPASSGERALGLTVPLFAAIASFYSQGSYAHAPRLMLLDEAFAGIDDTARAHCMGLIREFDLDFVITSEREWGCYAELPGVAICQLQRREGIDAVYVSRWIWDGRAKRREDDPDRRFAPV